MTVSPYALLCASRPQPAPSVVTPYDLYSSVHQEHAAAMPAAAEPPAAPSIPIQTLPAAPRKTHYIADIHARHSTAGKSARFTHDPLHS